MTERIRGLGFGKFVAGFIGIMAMAALVTGAVAASNGPHGAVALTDPTGSAAATQPSDATATAIATAKLHETEEPSAVESAEPTKAPKSEPTSVVAPGASCNPSLDNAEDAAERAAGKTGDDEDQGPNASSSSAPKPTEAPEPSEPASCLKVDPDSHGDQMSGKTDSTAGTGKDGPGQSWGGDKGGHGPSGGLPAKGPFGH
jgi:hypothetical protein